MLYARSVPWRGAEFSIFFSGGLPGVAVHGKELVRFGLDWFGLVLGLVWLCFAWRGFALLGVALLFQLVCFWVGLVLCCFGLVWFAFALGCGESGCAGVYTNIHRWITISASLPPPFIPPPSLPGDESYTCLC